MIELWIIKNITPIFYKLIELSLAAVCIGVVVLILRKIADKRISPFWKNALWLLVLVALLMPYRPSSPVAVMPETEILQKVSDEVAEIEMYETSKVQEIHVQNKSPHFQWHFITTIVWLFGMLAMLAVLLIGNIRLKCRDEITDSKIQSILYTCKNELNIRQNIKIYRQTYLSSPALYGLINPKILMPNYAENLSENSLRYILLHELCHLKHCDLWKNAILLILQIVYWFNPLVWLLFRYIRQDMELLNDTRVLKILDKSEKNSYALSLVEVLGYVNKLPLAPHMLCMVDERGNTKRRIQMIKLGETFKKHRITISVACLVAIAVIGAMFLTQKPEEAPATVKVGSYTCEGLYHEGGLEMIPNLYISEEKTVTYSPSIFSSFAIFDEPYEIVGDTLQFSYSYADEPIKFVFKIVGDTLVLDKEASTNTGLGFENIPDGSVFTIREDEEISETPVPTEIAVSTQPKAIWPLPAEYVGITSNFGVREGSISGEKVFHNGIDIEAPVGTEIYAIFDGEVISCGYDTNAGNFCVIDCGDGLTVIYNHMSELAVETGDKVLQSEIIGYVGATGWATGAHLHYELRQDDISINPMEFYE